jgi:hypothetical protein
LTTSASLAHGRHTISYSCNNWTSGGTTSGAFLEADGGVNTGFCTAVRPLACCDTVPRVQFVGFTSTNVTFSAAGRTAMHQKCDAEFPGSYMCHSAEYLLAGSTEVPPANGAWLDPSSDTDGGLQVGGASPAFGRYIGSTCCGDWTLATTTVGAMVQPDGGISSNAPCNVLRRVACCQVPP